MASRNSTTKPTPDARAVGYIRMSSDRQEASPDQQRAEIVKLAEKRGYQIVRFYSDEAISGDRTEKRKDFQRMIADAQRGEFATIIAWDVDRFGRFDSLEAGFWIHPLRKAGVVLETVTDGVVDWESFGGRIVSAVRQEGKHQFLIDLSQNVLRGQIASAKRGNTAGSPAYGLDRELFDEAGKLVRRVPYGEKFTRPKGWSVRFVASEDRAAVAIVQGMFREFANAETSISSLAQDLNARGVPSPRGNKWSRTGVQYILDNPVYAGTARWGGHPSGKYHIAAHGEIEKRNGHLPTGGAVLVEDVHEAIVDADLFQRVQDKLGARKHGNHRPRQSSFILSGVLRCGHCGGPMHGSTSNKADGRVYRRYTCSTGGSCPGVCYRHTIPADVIERYVLGMVESVVLAPNAAESVKEAIRRRAEAEALPADPHATAALRKRLAALDAKITRAAENVLLAEKTDLSELSAVLATWKVDRAAVQAELDAGTPTVNGRPVDERIKAAEANLERLREALGSDDPAIVRSVVVGVVKAVKLWFEPYGKRNRRMAHGEIELQDLARGSRP